MKESTFVTALFDIGRNHPEETYKFSNYLSWLLQLCQLDIQLIIFTSGEIAENLPKKENIHIIIRNEVPLINHKNIYQEQCWNINKYWTNNPQKDTIEFGLLTHSKFIWLLEAMQNNPFKTDYFFWIDAGIIKVAQKPELIPFLSQGNNDKIKFCQINPIHLAEFNNLGFFLQCRYKLAGGFFGGGKNKMDILCRQMIWLRDGLFKAGIFGFEQEYMAQIFATNPSIFSPYQGDFQYLFTNYPFKTHPQS